MDLSKLSDDELQAISSGDMSKLSDSALQMIAGQQPETKQGVSFAEKALSPSEKDQGHWYDPIRNTAIEYIEKPTNRFIADAAQAFKEGSAGVARLLGQKADTPQQEERFKTIENLSRAKAANAPDQGANSLTQGVASTVPYLASGLPGMANFMLGGVNRAYDLPIQNEVDQPTANRIAGLDTASRVATAAIPFGGRSIPEIMGLAGATTAMGAGEKWAEKKLLEENNPNLAQDINPLNAKELLSNYVLGVGFPAMAKLPYQDRLGVGAFAQPAKEAVGKLASKPLAPFAKRVTPEAARLQNIAESKGLNLSPADVTQSKPLALVESLMDKIPTSSGVAQRFRQGQIENFSNEFANPLLDKYGAKGKTLGQVGEESQASIARRSQAYDNLVGRKFKKANDLFPKEAGEIPINEGRNVAQKIIKDESRLLESIQDPEALNVLNDIAGMGKKTVQIAPASKVLSATGEPLSPAVVETKPATMSFDAIQKNMSRIKSIIRAHDEGNKSGTKFQSDETAGMLKRVVGALESDIDSFAANHGKEFQAAWKDARNTARLGYELFDSGSIRRIMRNDPEKLIGRIAPKSETEIARIKQAVGPRQFEQLKGRWIENQLKADEKGLVKPSALHNALSKFDEGTLKQMFKPQELNEIRDIANIGKMIQKSEQIAGNPSGTAQNVIGYSQMGSSAGLIGSGLATGNPGLVAAGVAELVAPPVLAKMYLSPIGRKYLTQGYKLTPGTPAATAWLAKTNDFAKGVLKDERGTVGADINFNHDNLNTAAVRGADSLALQNIDASIKPVVKMTPQEARTIKPGSGKIVFPYKNTTYVMDVNAVHNLINGKTKAESIATAKNMLRSGDESALLNYPVDRNGPTGAVTKQGDIVTNPADIVKEGTAKNLAYGAEGNPAELAPKLEQVSNAIKSKGETVPSKDTPQVYENFDIRKNTELRQRIDEIYSKPNYEWKPEDYDTVREVLFRNDTTGLGNQRAFEKALQEMQPGDMILNMDVDALKLGNDLFGHDFGNAMLQATADSMKEAGIPHALNPHGDEFGAVIKAKAGINPEAAAVKARKILESKILKFTDQKTGEVHYVQGVSFSHGIGKTFADSEGALQSSKAAREASGERPARGEIPKRLSEVVPTGKGSFEKVQDRSLIKPEEVFALQSKNFVKAAKEMGISEDVINNLVAEVKTKKGILH